MNNEVLRGHIHAHILYVNGVSCGVVEWVKRNTLRWFGHIERMGSEEFMKNVYVSESVGPDSGGRPLGRWRDRVKEYMCERGAAMGVGLDQARRECLVRERWRFFYHGHPLGGCSQRERERESNKQVITESIFFCMKSK